MKAIVEQYRILSKTPIYTPTNSSNEQSGIFIDGGRKWWQWPVSIIDAGLSFIQDQITFLQAFARIGGKRYILLAPTATADGVVVIDGEVLRFKAAAGQRHSDPETTENIVADGTTYREARIYRYAEYVPTYTKNVPGYIRPPGSR